MYRRIVFKHISWQLNRIIAFLAIVLMAQSGESAPVSSGKNAGKSSSKTAPAETAADDMARRAVGAIFSEDRASIRPVFETAQAADAHVDPTQLRLSDAIAYLHNSSIPDREQLLAALETNAQTAQCEDIRTRYLLSLLDDEYYEMNQLKGQDKFNKFTRIFNRASSSLSKLALFQPQDAAQLLLDAVYGRRKAKTPSERERRIVYLSRAFIKKYPDAPERAEVEELGSRLRQKLMIDSASSEKALGVGYLENGNYGYAEFHLENATLENPSDEEAHAKLAEARAAAKQFEERLGKSLGVSGFEQHLSDADNQVLADAVIALCNGNYDGVLGAASRSPRLVDSGAYAAAALLEKNGQHDAALAQLVSVARSYPSSPGGNAASGALKNPSYNLDEQFGIAVEEIKAQQKQLILTGNRNKEDNAYAASSAALQSGGQAATGVPFLFATDMLVRGIAEHFKSQVPVDKAVDAGARYIRKYPESARAREIAYHVGELSKRSGEYGEAEEYFNMAGGASAKDQASIRENKARKLFSDAMASDDLIERKSMLERASKEYSDCKIMKSVHKELARLHPTLERGGILLTAEMLKRDPSLARQLGISMQLMDGRKSNGEIAAQGIAIDARARNYSFLLKDEDEFRVGQIPESASQDVKLKARQLRMAGEFRLAGKDTLDRQKFPFAVEGGAGGSGVEIAPKIIPLKDTGAQGKYFRE